MTGKVESPVSLAIVIDREDFRFPNEFGHSTASVFKTNLGSALSEISRNSQQIILADAMADMELLFPEGLPLELGKHPITCRYLALEYEGKIWSRAAEMATAFIRKLMLGTGKNANQPGILLIDQVAIRELSNEGFEIDSTEQLISACRTSGRVVTENKISRHNSAEHASVSLKPTMRDFGNSLRFWWQNIAFPAPREAGSLLTELPDRQSKPWTRKTKFALTLTLFAAASLILFSNLGYPLIEPDEAQCPNCDEHNQLR